MIDAMETLLLAWGAEQISPYLDVSIRSPLGSMGEDAPASVGGTRCLSTVECAVVMSQAAAAVDAALQAMAMDEPLGLGSRGRVLVRLAGLRYCSQPRLLVAEQCRLLGISPRTYRTRVDELHVDLAATLPWVARQQALAERGTPGAVAAEARKVQARAAERAVAKADKQRWRAGKAHMRALLAAKDGAA